MKGILEESERKCFSCDDYVEDEVTLSGNVHYIQIRDICYIIHEYLYVKYVKEA